MFRQLLNSLLGISLFFLIPQLLSGQSGNCDVSTPFYLVDLSGDEAGVFTSPSIFRNGFCCGITAGATIPRCLEFEVTLAPNSQGFIFDIETGLIPSGVNEYLIDCADNTLIGDPYCTTDPGPFTVTYCKPGPFPNTFSITSIPSDVQVDDINALVDCTSPITVTNLVESTVTWNDITSGTFAYNAFLDCTVGCLTTNISPDASAPASIQYEVCGEVENALCPLSTEIICDTVTVTVKPELEFTNIAPYTTYCPTDPGVLISAIPNQTGGDYVYWWQGVGPTADSTYFISGSGFYFAVIEDQDFGACSRDTIIFVVAQQAPSPAIFAPASICPGDTASISSEDLGPDAVYLWDFGAGAEPQTATGIGPHEVYYEYCGIPTLELNVVVDGCQGIVTQGMGVIDNTAPVITVNDATVNLGCNDPIPAIPTATVSDNCDDTPLLEFSSAIIAGICAPNYQIRYTWTATDTCGNVSTRIKNINIADNTSPVLSATPADITMHCDDRVLLVPNINATDDCDALPIVTFSESTLPHPSGCLDNYILERTWIAEDDCGNTATHVQNIEFVDQRAPNIISFESLITFDCDAAVPGFSGITADDDCDNSVDISFADSGCQPYRPNYYEDGNNDVVYIADTNDPNTVHVGIVANLALISVCTDDPSQYRRWNVSNPNPFPVYVSWTLQSSSQSGGYLAPPGNSYFFTSTLVGTNQVSLTWDDENGIPVIRNSAGGSSVCDIPDNVSCNICKIDRTITLTDNCGNDTIVVQSLLQLDQTGPVITGIPADVEIGCVPCLQVFDNGDFEAHPAFTGNATFDESLINGWETTVAGNDIEFFESGFEGVPANSGNSFVEVNSATNGYLFQEFCSIPTTILQISFAHRKRNFIGNITNDIVEVFAGPNIGSLTSLGTFTATAASGWSIHSVNYTVPVGQLTTVFAFQTVQGAPAAPAIGNLIDNVSLVTLINTNVVPTVTDNCDINVALQVSEQRIDGACDNEFLLLRTWTATDDCGNVTSATQRVSVGDFEPPTLDSLPPDVTYNCEESFTIYNPIFVASISTCVDGIQNGNETGVDCGGSDCPACPSCTDGIQNGGETDIDCGGPDCDACPTCSDGIQNGNETGVDCGGPDCATCPTCVDGIQNGSETGVDCGGPDCTACSGCTDITVTINFDNYPEETRWEINTNGTGTTVASGGTYPLEPDGSTLAIVNCLPDGCYNFVIYDSANDGICCGYGNGSYTVTDGATVLASGGVFGASESTLFCINTPLPATCVDGIQNGSETGVDCGGPDCAACPTCVDGILNGNETGIDCGGPDCPVCPSACLEILNESFEENNFGAWIDGGTDASNSNSNAYTGSRSIRLRDNSGSSDMRTRPTDFTPFDEVSISFTFITENFSSGEDIILEYSTNGGSSYTTATSWVMGTDFNNGERIFVDYTFPAAILDNNAVIQIQCDASSDSDRVYIDDTVIEVCDTGSGNLDWCSGGTLIEYSDFQSGLGNWNDGGNRADHRVNNNYPNSGNGHVRLRDNSGAASSIYSDPYDFSAYGTINFFFSFFPTGNENGEDLFFEYSTNGGTSYTTIDTWARGTDYENDIRYYIELALPAGAVTANTVLRLRADGSGTDDIYYIDDVKIQGCGTPFTNPNGQGGRSITGGNNGSFRGVIESCRDGVKNGDETGIDCGGLNCLPCGGQKVKTQVTGYQDRISASENGSRSTCLDNIQNGDETGIDCGGSICPPCGANVTYGGVSDNCSSDIDVVYTLDTIPGTCDHEYQIIQAWTLTDGCGNDSTYTQTITVIDDEAPIIYGTVSGNTAPTSSITYDQENGNDLDYGIENVSASWSTITYPTAFTNTPVVLAQVVSNNESDPVTIRIRNVNSTSFEIRLQEEENLGSHGNETVHWIAMEEGSFNNGTNQYVVDLSSTIVDDGWEWLNYNAEYIGTHCIIANTQTYVSADPFSLRQADYDNNWGWNAVGREEQSADSETGHSAEAVGFFMSLNGDLENSSNDVIGEIQRTSITTSNRSDWDAISFSRSYDNPIVVVGPASIDGEWDAGEVRVRNVTSTGFEIQYQEWTHLNGSHASETVAWMVIGAEDNSSSDSTMVWAPEDITVNCDEVPEEPTMTATDNCTMDVPVVFTQDSTGSACNYLLTRTWTATDECGNINEIEQEINVQDTMAPIFTLVPADITLYCDDLPAPATLGNGLEVADDCDPNLILVLDSVSTQTMNNSCTDMNFTITRTWTASDNCGNISTASQTITSFCECCGNGIDDDNDGLVDGEDPDCPCVSGGTSTTCDTILYYYVPPVWQMHHSSTNNPSDLVMTTPFPTANVRVYNADGSFDNTYTVVNGTPTTINTTIDELQTPNNATVEQDRGWIIESDRFLQVYYRINAHYNKVLVTIKGEQALGTAFRAGSQTKVCGGPAGPDWDDEGHFVSVMAVEDNTTVDFEFVNPMMGIVGLNHSVNLDAGETYLVRDRGVNESVTGSLITSDNPIAVLSGSQHNLVCGVGGRDAGIDQLVPTCLTGTDYVVLKSQGDSRQHYAIVVALENNTQVYINGSATAAATLNPGEYYEYDILGAAGDPTFINTNKSAYLYHVSGIAPGNSEVGMALVAPVGNCRGDTYTEFPKFNAVDDHSAYVIIPDAGLPSLTLNGNAYSTYTTARAVPGLPGYSTVYFFDADLLAYNTIASDDYYHAGLLIGNAGATGTHGYLTSFKDKIDVLDPVTDLPVSTYFVDTLCENTTLEHCIRAQSCAFQHYITQIIPGPNTAAVNQTSDLCFEYTAADNYSGIDQVTLIVENAFGLQKSICLRFYVCAGGPVFSDVPIDTTVVCEVGPPAVDTPSVFHPCVAEFVIDVSEVSTQTNNGGCSDNNYQIFRTFTADDECDNTNSVTQIITVIDTLGPVFTAIDEDVTVDCDAVPPIPDVIAIDNCFDTVGVFLDEELTGDICNGGYIITRTWSASDICGNQSTLVQTINITASGGPSILNVPADTSVSCESIPVAASPDAPNNCYGQVNLVLAETIENQVCSGTYDIVRTWTATDLCNNQVTEVQRISVFDNQAPIIDGVGNDTLVECHLIPDPNSVIGFDNCTMSTVTLVEVVSDSICEGNYTLTRTWTVADDCGNESVATQVLTVFDDTAPTLTNYPNNITIECSFPSDTFQIEAIDNCSSDFDFTFDQVEVPAGEFDFSPATTFNTSGVSYDFVIAGYPTLTAADFQSISLQFLSDIGKGNAELVLVAPSGDAIVLIGNHCSSGNCDDADPAFESYSPSFYHCGPRILNRWNNTSVISEGAGDFLPAGGSVTGLPGSTSFVDCFAALSGSMNGTWSIFGKSAGASQISLENLTFTIAEDQCVDPPLILRHWEVLDLCGNGIFFTQEITLEDNGDPTIATEPADITLECGSAMPDTALVFNDDCSTITNVDFSEVIDDTDPCNVEITRTWIAYDDCNNQLTVDQIITAVDTQDPTFDNTPSSISDINCGTSLPAQETLTASDNCGSATVTMTDNIPANPDYCAGFTVTYTWTATDDCGRTAVESTSFDVLPDTSDPTFNSRPAAIENIGCDDAYPTQEILTASDACGSATVTMTDNIPANPDYCAGFTVTYTWTATDECGNTAVVTQDFDVQADNSSMVFSGIPADVTVECNAIPVAAVVSASDVCGNTPTVVFSESIDLFEKDCTGFRPLDLSSVTGVGGNTAIVQQPILSSVLDVLNFDADITANHTSANSNRPDGQVNGDLRFRNDSNADVSEYRLVFDEAVNFQLSQAEINGAFERLETWTITTVGGPINVNNPVVNVITSNATNWNDTELNNVTGDGTNQVVFNPRGRSSDGHISVADSEWSLTALGVTEIIINLQTSNAGANATRVKLSVDCVPLRSAISGCPYTINRKWVATDFCGNQDSAFQYITVEDTEGPTLSTPAAIADVNCDDGYPTQETLITTDACGSASITMTDNIPANPDYCAGFTVTYTWTAEDECGNETVETATFDVLPDTSDPTFDQAPGDLRDINCDAAYPTQETLTASDACGTARVVATDDIPANPDYCAGFTVTYTWTATDECGNTAVTTRSFDVLPDTGDPTFDQVPTDLVDINCDAGYPTQQTLTASDACGTASVVATDDIPVNPDYCAGFTVTYTWTATDECGNTASVQRSFDVLPDTGDPTFDQVPTNLLDINCDATYPTQQTLTASDACGTASVVATDNIPANPDYCVGFTVTYTWTATDECGNTAVTTRSFDVLPDTGDPTFNQSPAFILGIDCDDAYPTQETLTASDACGTASVVGTDDIPANPDYCAGFTVTYTWTATDECGNTAVVTRSFDVSPDTSDPTFDQTPRDISDINCDAAYPTPQTLTASDICGTATVVVTDNIPANPDYCAGFTVTYTWTATDECGNTANVQRSFDVLPDTGDPTFDQVPTNLVDINCDAAYPTQQTLTASDACGTASVVGTDDIPANPDYCAGFTVTYTWTATDECGNTAAVTRSFDVLPDSGDPTFDQVPTDLVDINCDAAYPTQQTLTASDACGTASVVATDDIPANPDYCAGFTVTYTWTATDECGNTAVTTRSFDVLPDTGDPTFDQVPTDLVDINCDAGYPTQQTLTASDACGTASVVGTDDIPANPDYCAGFTVTYTWTATDECGNTASVQRSFDVLPDTGDPTFDQVPTDLVDINCDAAYPTQQTLTASDACGTASVVATDDIPVNPDYCAGFTVTYTWTATDECGNTAVTTRSFDVLPDTGDPTFDQVPTDLVDINCDAAYPTQQTLTASDACGTASVVGTDDIPANPDYCAGFTVTYTWTATDECGNTAVTTRSFDVLPDTGDPTFDQVPTDLVDINCDAAYPAQQTLTASDACGTASVVGTDDIPANPDYCAGFTVTYTWTATDECGNTAVTTRSFDVLPDTSDPTFDQVPTDLVDINCDAAYPTQQTLTASDACGTASVVGTDDIPANPDYCAGFTVTYTWTATDECGNTAVTTRSFDVLPDTSDPTFDQVPTDLVDINCDAAYPTQQTLTASDACGTASVVATDDIPANPDYCAGFTVTYTWTATDECGNTASVQRSFDVLPDTGDPTFDQVPTNLVDINCDAAYPTQQTLTASDACGTASVVGTDDIPANPDYCAGFTVTYTWTATDECGNTAVTTRSFDVLPDTGDPTFNQSPAFILGIDCDDAYPMQETLTASDACGTASVVATDDIPANPDYCAGFTVTYTWTATDECGNTAVTTRSFDVSPDTEDPTFDQVPTDLVDINCDAAYPTQQTLTASDACGTASVVGTDDIPSNPDYCAGFTVTYTWTATDECGNTAVVTRSFDVLPDTGDPTFDQVPTDLVDINCDAGYPTQQTLTASDACGTASVVGTDDIPSNPDYCAGFTVTYTWTATDECGNTAVTTRSFDVLPDTSDPTFDQVPTDLVDITCDAAYPTQQTLTASDACGTASVVGTDDIPANPDYCAGFTVTYTWTATDECGNTANVQRSFDVLPDTGDPTFDQVPTDLVDINCDAGYPTQQTLTASDACGTASVVGTDDIPANPDYCAGFTVTYTWTATDECGNTAAVTRSFDVLPDTGDPTFDQVPTDLVDINCDAAYPTQQILTASDACGTASVVGTDDIPANPDYCAGFTVTYTWTATDECGNTALVTRSFDVLPDTGDPTFDQVPTDLVDINCDAAYPTQQTLTASDACGTASVVGTDDIPANPDYCAGFTVTFTWTATDECGNTASVQRSFDVLPDTGAPTFDQVPTDLVDINCDAAYPTQQTLTASDACGTASVVGTDDIPANPDYCAGFTVTYTWTATDECGNTAVVTRSFDVLPDTGDPTFDQVPTDLVDINCDAAYPTQQTLTASDACGTASVVATDDIPANPDYCAGFTVTYTWTATDECGNTAVTTRSFDVLPDTSDPTFDQVPTDLVDINCDAAYPTQQTLTASDACGTASVLGTDDIPANPDYCAGFTVTYSWTATDECGNTAVTTRSFDVLPDTSDPTFDQVPTDLVDINCDAAYPTQQTLTASDACGTASVLGTDGHSSEPRLLCWFYGYLFLDSYR